jgi:hypothetical protein
METLFKDYNHEAIEVEKASLKVDIKNCGKIHSGRISKNLKKTK